MSSVQAVQIINLAKCRLRISTPISLLFLKHKQSIVLPDIKSLFIQRLSVQSSEKLENLQAQQTVLVTPKTVIVYLKR
jgi:hypothetical protein